MTIAAVFVPFVLTLAGCAMQPSKGPEASPFAAVDKVKIGGEGGWDFITFDAISQRLFISRGDRVQVWNARTRRIDAEIAGTSGVHGIAIANDLHRGFTSNGRANSVSVFGLDDLKVTRSIDVQGVNPDAILYEPFFKRLYTFNGRSADATVIDAVGLKVLSRIALGGKPEVAVSDGAGHVFVNLEDTAEIVMIDEATSQVRARWPLAPCTEPTGLAIDAVHKRLFSVCANQKMVVLDAATGRLVAEVPIGDGPDGAGFDPGLGLAFSSNGDGSLTVIHEDGPDHFSVVADIATAKRARTMSLDSKTHRVFLVSAEFGPVQAATASEPKPRAPMIPDSFAVLVVAPK
jgi:DNA-binding beta-propeller fold protein YncE